ncbi:hypothetical protein AB6A23_22605 [Paenibacillus tarimensis]
MTKWQGAWHIVKTEMRRERFGLLLSFLFITYLSFILLPLFNEALQGDYPKSSRWLLDFMYISLLPNFGYVMNRTMFKVWRDDPVSKRIAIWRTMPIKNAHIALSRLVGMHIVLVGGWLYFFAVHYVLAFRYHMELGTFVGIAVFWLGYSAVMASSYIYWEMGYSGKTFTILCTCYFPIYGLVVYLIFTFDRSAVFGIMEAVKAGMWWVPALSLLAAGCAAVISYTAICKRLAMRNLMN